MTNQIDYYDLFLKNKLAIPRKEFKITFSNGQELIGIPISSSFEKPNEISFQLKYKDESGKKVTESFLINSISSAEAIK